MKGKIGILENKYEEVIKKRKEMAISTRATIEELQRDQQELIHRLEEKEHHIEELRQKLQEKQLVIDTTMEKLLDLKKLDQKVKLLETKYVIDISDLTVQQKKVIFLLYF
jgi:predicted RNase H-like nuclease (RuvC/YqgF family)